MTRLVQLVVPISKLDATLSVCRDLPHIHGLSDVWGSSTATISFRIAPKHLSDAIAELQSQLGLGIEWGTIDTIPLSSTLPALWTLVGTAPKKRSYRMHDRMSVAEVVQTIDGQSHLTFDYLCMLAVAAVISAAGLITDSSVNVVASMLVSPLMGPILCLTLGSALRDSSLVYRGIRNEAWGVFVCVLVGYIFGIAAAPFYGQCGVDKTWASHEINSFQINSRGTSWGLIGGAVVAVPSGIGVALGITGGEINALVGVAISVALLPPVVNTGLSLGISTWWRACEDHPSLWHGETHPGRYHSDKWLKIAGWSMVLFLLNFACIWIFAYLMFKLKRITPGVTRSQHWQKALQQPVSRPRAGSDTSLYSGADHRPTSRRASRMDPVYVDPQDPTVRSISRRSAEKLPIRPGLLAHGSSRQSFPSDATAPLLAPTPYPPPLPDAKASVQRDGGYPLLIGGDRRPFAEPHQSAPRRSSSPFRSPLRRASGLVYPAEFQQ